LNYSKSQHNEHQLIDQQKAKQVLKEKHQEALKIQQK